MNQALVLLIWEENPEQIKFYLLPEEEANKHREYLDQAHDKMINSDDMNDGMRFLNTALASHEAEVAEEGFEDYLGVWAKHQYKHTANPITGVNITKVYKSGFCL